MSGSAPQDAAKPVKDQPASPQPEPSTETPEQLPSTSKSSAPKEENARTAEGDASQLDPAHSDFPTDARYNFYLLRPRTSSNRRVLVPLTPSDTLGDALRGCTVEEFPTIFYFASTMSELPQNFMLDEDYRKEEGEQQREFEELMKDVDPEILKRLKDDGTSNTADEEVDSKKILDVLRQDLGGL
jgi:hypothetical protein